MSIILLQILNKACAVSFFTVINIQKLILKQIYSQKFYVRVIDKRVQSNEKFAVMNPDRKCAT
jgi:hypothetical protein